MSQPLYLSDSPVINFLGAFGFVLLGSLAFSPCKGAGKNPANIPADAEYNRKTNVYLAQIGNKQVSYFKKGELISEKEVNAFGIADGESKTFYYKDSSLLSIGKFQNGERSGKWTWLFPSGKPYIELNFTPGVRKKAFWMSIIEWGNENGPYFRYFPSGNLQEKGFYDGGNKTGDWVRYYPDTKIESKGSYSEDKKVGEWLHYSPEGSKEAFEAFSQNGDLLLRQLFDSTGKLRCEQRKTEKAVCFTNQ
jgi:antitoxin component YwqK of YwqJK toxin-antitoxin module